MNSCSRDSEHIYDTIPANTSHHYDVLEGPTLESDHELQDVSEEGDTRDKLRNCQDDFEVRERDNLFAPLTFKHVSGHHTFKIYAHHNSDCVNNLKKLFEEEFSFLLYTQVNL